MITQRCRGDSLHKDRVEEVYISLCYVYYFCFHFICWLPFSPHGRCVGHAARPVSWVNGILAAETAVNTLLWPGNPLDGRSELGRSDQAAGHGFQVGVQKVWVGLLWTDSY